MAVETRTIYQNYDRPVPAWLLVAAVIAVLAVLVVK